MGTYVMNLPVGSQITTLSKLLVTDVTFIRLIACVSSNVDLKSARAHERLAADVTLERSFSSVPPEVVREVSMGCE